LIDRDTTTTFLEFKTKIRISAFIERKGDFKLKKIDQWSDVLESLVDEINRTLTEMQDALLVGTTQPNMTAKI
jgi:hypothetical protein